MLRFFTLIAFMLMLTSMSYAQNPIFEAIETAKNSSTTFKNVKPLAEKGSISKNGKFQTSLSEGVLFEINKTSLTNLTKEKNEALRFEIEQGEGKKPLVLELIKTELLGTNFRILTDNSPNKGVDFHAGIHYRGIVSGDRNSAVALSIYDGEIMSVINSESSGNLVLGKTAKEGEEYILYNPAAAIEKPPFDCGTADVPLTQQQIDGMMNYQNTAGKVDNCVNVFLELDYTLVVEKGGRQGAINYVTGLFNVVATLYQVEEITVKISEMFVWENEDPYAFNSSIDALLKFRETRSEFNGDLAHLISRGAPAGGGVAWVNALCTSYNYAYSYVYNSYNELPSYSWSVNVIAHEMGHNLGSPHTHACTWNGNNTPLDGCGAQAGYSEGCEGPIPTNGGTVMSYCHLLSGVGINLQNGLGQQPGDLIRNAINNASCLTTCDGTPPPTTCQTISITKNDSRCFGEADGIVSVNITDGTAPYQIQWSNGMTGNSLNNLSAGNYSVVVTDANNCVATASTTILQPTGITLATSVTNESLLGANDGSIILTASGGTPPYSFLWSDGSTSQNLTNKSAGTYSVEIFDANQCLTTTSFQISVENNSHCHEIAIEKTNGSCFGFNDGTAEISISGGTAPFAIQWSNGLNSYMNAGLAPGDYSVIVMDATGCFVEATTTIEAPDQITVSSQSTNESASGETDGGISLNITGGTLPFTFEWSNGSTTKDLSNVNGGDYSVIITDANGCSVSYSETIKTNVNCHEITVEKADASCFDSNDGSASVSISGGLPPFSIEWSHGATSEQVSNLELGEYQVFVFDATGCFTSASFEIAAPEAIEIKLEKTNLSEDGTNDGTINLTVSGGTAPYAIEWSNGSTAEDLTDLEVGFYEVIVTDAAGCFEAAEVEITAPVAFNCTPLVELPAYQGFENGWKQWTQESEDGATWRLKSGKTATRRTGPNRAKKGRIYTYMEANRNHNKSASLVSPCLDLNGTISPKLTFAYHMKGVHQGALAVEISTDAGDTWEEGIFNLEGHQANGWRNAVVDLSGFAFQTIKVKITGTIGDGNKSDIALDRIRITDQGSTLPSTKEADGLVDIRNLAIAPNPVIDWVVIEFESAQSTEVTIHVLNMLGKPVRREVVQTVLGRNALEIDLADLEGGYYFVNITDGKRFLSEKLVKVKW